MKSFHSLRTLFLWPLVTLTICALGLSSLGIYYLASAKIENELALRGTIMTNSIEAALETHRSPSDFDRFMLAIGGEADINDVYIVDENFHAITPRGTAYTSDESSVAIQQLLQLALTSKITQTARYQRNQFLIAKPILLTSSSAIPAFNTSRGVIFMNLSTTSSQHLAFYTALALTAFLTLISVITQFMVFRLVKTWVLVPSQKIVKTIALQKNGNNAQTQLQPINEIGLIGKTLDDLFIELHQREQTLLEKAQETDRFNTQIWDLATNLSQARDGAEQASKAKSEFLANMSHELRTPLNGVLGIMQLLQKTELSPQQKKLLQTASYSGELLLSVINDVLDFSKIQAGKMQLESIAFQADLLFQTTLDGFMHLAREKNITLGYQSDPLLPQYLLGDPTRLKQIISNLVSNALKFTQQGSINVILKLMPSENQSATYQLCVEDTGIGMNELQLSRIFTAFDQGDNSITRAHGGTGLGLTIIGRLIDMMQGTISVSSQPGKGTIFTVTLPLVEATTADITAILLEKNQQKIEFSGQSILVVDDNKTNQLLAKHLLTDMGLQVTLRSNGALAVAAVQTNNFCAVLMDMQMPIMDGLEATKRIRLLPEPKASILIIAMTANVGSQDKEKCLSAGMNGHISKPIDGNHVAEILASFIAPSRVITLPDTSSNSATTTQLNNNTGETSINAPSQLTAIDLPVALNRVNGNWPFLYKLLKQFIVEQQTMIEHLPKITDAKALIIKLHTLKGSAANLGAVELSAIAAQMEQDAKNQRLDLVANHLSTLEQKWQQLVSAFNSLSAEYVPASITTKTVMSIAETKALLNDLQQCLNSDLSVAENLMKRLIDSADTEHIAITKSIQEAFTNFDIDQTKKLLNLYNTSILSA